MTDIYVWLTVALIALVTALTRFLPFLIFGGKKKPPRIIERLGKLLPYAIMGMLVVYCLRETSFKSFEGFLPALVACFVVGGSYVWKRNTLVSIVLGTLSYMILVQVVL